MKTINQSLAFQGQWRSYQARVLEQVTTHMRDGKIHIVAAPGSGKTTLGIELIRRLGEPCLILSPSVNIRDQWIARIKEAFLPPGTDTAGLLSVSLREPAPITAITYQALHSGISRYRGKGEAESREEDEEDELGTEAKASRLGTEAEAGKLEEAEAVKRETETVDYSDFDFYATVKAAGIRTICLDEAHHLRSEWWKALEEMMKTLTGVRVISLTATPPYDSTPAEWERYDSLCGPIDEEIIVPELVKEGSLCPHQDYVYFNMPTKEEEQAVLAFRQGADRMMQHLLDSREFAAVVKTHIGLGRPLAHADQFLEEPAYLTAILIYLEQAGIPFSKELVRLLGAKGKLPPMSPRFMEKLLQGILYDDRDSYMCDNGYREQLIAELKAESLIQKNKVSMSSQESVNKLLRTSKGKIRSIMEIVKAEHRNLGEELRLLILTDYIKKEMLPAVGNPEKPVNELGVVPIFENIRRELSGLAGLRVGVLSGSVVIIPEEAKGALENLFEARGITGSLKECGAPGYYLVTVSGTEYTASALLTELFGQGFIRVLIGTKSLLGEGWDSPSINSLILASFVGSFMLSNQMRGRAIRTMKGKPDKVSNIWHLVCMEPEALFGSRSAEESQSNVAEPHRSAKDYGGEESEDFATLRRRFEGFLGVHYDADVIENGFERLTFAQPPYGKGRVNSMNQKMLKLAADRPALRKRWEDSLAIVENMQVTDEVGINKKALQPGVLGINALLLLLVPFIFVVFLFGSRGGETMVSFIAAMFVNNNPLPATIVVISVLFCNILFVMRKLLNRMSPWSRLRSIGNAVMRALQKSGHIISPHVGVKVEAADRLDMLTFIYLKGGTLREKTVFSQAVCEFFAEVDNQRYLLRSTSRFPVLCKYFIMPELFSKRREDGEIFVAEIKKPLGPYEMIYTRSAEGRKILLEARMKAYGNINNRLLQRKKRVKSAFE